MVSIVISLFMYLFYFNYCEYLRLKVSPLHNACNERNLTETVCLSCIYGILTVTINLSDYYFRENNIPGGYECYFL